MPMCVPHLNLHAQVQEQSVIRLACIGCGSHAVRNIFSCFQFLPVRLIACCDLDVQKAELVARQFGATATYSDVEDMLEQEELDAVCIVTGYNDQGRPRYPKLAQLCLSKAVHVWIEKPPASSTNELHAIKQLAEDKRLTFAVGFKKMYMPANQKALALMHQQEKPVHQILMQYPQRIPSRQEMQAYRSGQAVASVISFLDHLCHPLSALRLFMGEIHRCVYYRNDQGAGSLLCFNNTCVAHIALCLGHAQNGGMERSCLIGDGYHINVENNLRVSLCRNPRLGYGDNPDFYLGDESDSTICWEPEFSLGQMYNKGICLLGYYHELNAFVQAVLGESILQHGHVDDALVITQIFEALLDASEGEVLHLDEP